MCDPCRTKLGTLEDEIRRCDVKACTGTWVWTVASQLEAFATKRPPPRGICASCEGKLAALEDKHIACGIPGCTRKAVLSKRAQLLAELAGPAGDAGGAAPGIGEAPSPEAVVSPANEPGLEPNGAAAVALGDAAADAGPEGETGAESGANGKHGKADRSSDKHPPRGRVTFKGPYCDPCFDVSRRIQDRPVHCGINGCKRKWIWKADEQIQAFAAGKPNEPPRRMCDPCRASFGKLLDRPVRCRTSGCKNTWVWGRFDQLDACVADKPPPKAPPKMCDRCWGIYEQAVDVERPCRKPGCKNTWTDKRGAQLARAVRGKAGDPYPQYCDVHKRELGELEDREIPCRTDGCPGTWTWNKQQQLAAGVRPELKEPEAKPDAQATPDAAEEPAALAAQADAGEIEAAAEPAEEGKPGAPMTAIKGGKPRRQRDRHGRKRRRQIQPPERHCHACVEFLKDRKTQELPCTQCATPIYWPPESQLQTHLGNWTAPSLCGACKRDATEAARKVARETLVRQAMEQAAANAPAHQAAGGGDAGQADPAPAVAGDAPPDGSAA
jgi:hypothetical protein